MDRRSLGVLTGDSPDLCEQLGLWTPITDEMGSTAAASAAVSPGAAPFIPPPTRERLMAGSANLRRVYKIEA